MISKFDSLFAGHVDMENVGYVGTAVNDRLFSNEHLATAFSKAEAIAQLMDRSGYDTFWMAEHHFQPEGYECIPKRPHACPTSCPFDRKNRSRMRLQHRANVAPTEAGRGLRHR